MPAKLYSEMTAEELLAAYNEYERKLYSGGKDYRDIPDDAFENIEGWIERTGHTLVKPRQGLSSLKRAE